MMLNQDLAELLFDPLSDEELSELSEHFDDLHDSLESMNFSMIDGFFTALVLSPNAQLPEKWLEMILVDMDAFNKMPKRTDIVELLYRHYQQIKLSLSVMTPPEFEPIYLYHDAHEQPWVADWCYGFVQGVQADLDVWQNLTGVFPMLELITAISTLPPPNEAPLAWQEDFSEEDALFYETQQMALRALEEYHKVVDPAAGWDAFLELLVFSIHDYMLHPQSEANNDLSESIVIVCPCGSDKPFELCCGSANRLIH